MFSDTRNYRVLAQVGAIVLIAAAALTGFRAVAADEVKCDKCVDTRDISKKAVTKSRIKPGAVNRTRLKDGAVTPEKLGYRAFDANNQVIGPVGFDGRVLFEVVGGEHNGKQVTAFVHQQTFSGAPLRRFGPSQVSYTMANCTGQAWLNHDDVLPENYALVSLAAVGPHPDFGADGSGNPIRLALLVPDTPNAVILPDVQDASYSEYDRETGTIKCFDINRGSDPGVLFDPIEDPNLSDFVPPFRVGTK